jgi:hypothetical protein
VTIQVNTKVAMTLEENCKNAATKLAKEHKTQEQTSSSTFKPPPQRPNHFHSNNDNKLTNIHNGGNATHH